MAIFRETLQERTRERVPLDWATTQNNLGNALQMLGWRRAERPGWRRRWLLPRGAYGTYARAGAAGLGGDQNDLGDALRTLGDRESGTARLEEAVALSRRPCRNGHGAGAAGLGDNPEQSRPALYRR